MVSKLIVKFKKYLKNRFSFFRYKKKFSSKILRNVQIDIDTRIGPFVILDGENGLVKIGKNCSINAFSWIGAGNSSIEIGNDVRIGSGTIITCANHIFKDRNTLIRKQGLTSNQNIVIDNDVWIGSNVNILPGITIGKGSVIGAGSTVVKDVEEYSVVVGNPAKKIKNR